MSAARRCRGSPATTSMSWISAASWSAIGRADGKVRWAVGASRQQALERPRARRRQALAGVGGRGAGRGRREDRAGLHPARSRDPRCFVSPVVAGGRMYILADNADADRAQLRAPARGRDIRGAPQASAAWRPMAFTVAIVGRPMSASPPCSTGSSASGWRSSTISRVLTRDRRQAEAELGGLRP